MVRITIPKGVELTERVIAINRVSKVVKGEMCIRDRYGTVGDVIIASVKEAIPNSKIKKGDVVRAVIVRVRKEIRRRDGTYVRFDDNAAVIIDNQGNPRGTRIFGPVSRELRDKGYTRIVSLAPEVV